MADNKELKKSTTAPKNNHSGHRKRLWDAYYNDPDNFEDYLLLELLLTFVFKRQNTNNMAHELYNTVGSLSNLFDADADEITSVNGLGYSTCDLLDKINGLINYVSDTSPVRLSGNIHTFAAQYVYHTHSKFFLTFRDVSGVLKYVSNIDWSDMEKLKEDLMIQSQMHHNSVNIFCYSENPQDSIDTIADELHKALSLLRAYNYDICGACVIEKVEKADKTDENSKDLLVKYRNSFIYSYDISIEEIKASVLGMDSVKLIIEFEGKEENKEKEKEKEETEKAEETIE